MTPADRTHRSRLTLTLPLHLSLRVFAPMRAVCIVAAWLTVLGVPALAASLYKIDQRFGTIGFSVSTLGMFNVEGGFPKFEGHLLVDPVHPERTRFDVNVDASAVEMPLPDQVELLRSPAYFDTAAHPTGRFVSTHIQMLSPSHYAIQGTLQIRGVTQPALLDAVLQKRHVNHKIGIDTADFVATGEIRRSAFGMVANQTMLSDSIRLRIRIRLALAPASDGG